MKMFLNHSDFCFHITIHEILDKKSLYSQKIVLEKKKSLLKILKKKQLFSKSLLRNDSGGTFCLHFQNLQKIWWK